MNKKQTQCPECTTIYHVSVAQLTIAQGMVCCPKCLHNFNALLHLVSIVTQQDRSETPQPLSSNHDVTHQQTDTIQSQDSSQQHLLQIFDRKIEHSNIDLHTYLNNLNYFSSDPIHQFPTLKLSEKELRIPEKHGLGYYVAWSLINLSLIAFLTFQILWFNPDLIQRFPILVKGLDYSCQLINCHDFTERYEKIHIDSLSIDSKHQKVSEFHGALINTDDKSMPLPKLKLSFAASHGEVEYIFEAQEYLEEKYQGIERLPSQTPFKFSFQVPIDKNQMQSPHLEIIKP